MLKLSIIVYLIFLSINTIAQPNTTIYAYVKQKTRIKFTEPNYKLRALIDLELNQQQFISTGIADTSVISIDSLPITTGVNDFYKDALVLSAYNFVEKEIDWSISLPAQEIHRAKTHLLNDTFYTAVSFTGKMLVDGVEIEGTETINALLFKTNQRGKLLSYKLINGLSFSDFAVNEQQLFFAGWYKYSFKLDRQSYDNDMDTIFENNRFYAAYNKVFKQQWVRVASHLVKPHHNNPFHVTNQLKIVHVSNDNLYLASMTVGIDPLVLGKDTLHSPSVKKVSQLDPYLNNTIRLFTLNTKNGLLSKYDCFYTRNLSGFNFLYDKSTNEVKTLVGKDSIINPYHGTSSGRDYKLYLNGGFVDFEEEYYLKVKFSESYDSIAVEKTGFDYGKIQLLAENEEARSHKLLFTSSYQDTASYFIKKLPANSVFQSYLFDNDGNGNYSFMRSNYSKTNGAINILKNDAYLENEYIKAYYNQGSDYPLVPANQDVVFYEAKQELIHSKPLADVFIPNAISPNGDGINDSLSLAPQDFKTLHWQIYARNGTLVYEGSGAWNGSFKGKTQLGNYTYIFTATTKDGKEIKRKGSVRVIR